MTKSLFLAVLSGLYRKYVQRRKFHIIEQTECCEFCVFGVKPHLNSSDKPFNLQWRWSCVTKQFQALSHVPRFSLRFCYKSLTSNGPLHLWHKLAINTKCLIRPAFFLPTSHFLAFQGTVYLFKCFLLKSKRQNWIPVSLSPLKCKRVAGR